MKNNDINIGVNICLTPKNKFSTDEKEKFLKEFEYLLEDFIELKILDLGLKYNNLIDGYTLDTEFNIIND